MTTGRENNIKKYCGIPCYYVAPVEDSSKNIAIFHSYSVENNGNFDIFRKILTIFVRIHMKNDYIFARVSQRDDMVLGHYGVIVIFDRIFSKCTKKTKN